MWGVSNEWMDRRWLHEVVQLLQMNARESKKIIERVKDLELHQTFHRVRYCKARFCHNLPWFLSNLWQSLHFTEFVRVFAELTKDLIALMCGCWWKVIFADCNNTWHNRDDLSEVLVQLGWWRWAADARKDTLNSIYDGFRLCLEIWLK